MDLQIKNILDKYWKGETTLSEERQIKEWFKANPDLSNEGQYFRKISQSQQQGATTAFAHPGKQKRTVWLSAAAAVLILMFSLPYFFSLYEVEDPFAVEDPTEAYEITRASLMMVSNGLNKGKTYSKKELNKINDAKSIIKKQ